jgi:hypothetical protein
VTSGQYTTASPTIADTLKEFFDVYLMYTQQPIAFTHRVHLAHGIQCTDCHTATLISPLVAARIPDWRQSGLYDPAGAEEVKRF